MSPLYSLQTPAQHPVITLVDSSGADVEFDPSVVNRATGVIAETFPRTSAMASVTPLVSGRASLVSIQFEAGQVVTSVRYFSGSVGLTSATNQWVALANSSRVKLAVSNDDGATAWSNNAAKTFTLTSPYTIPTTGMYYLALVVVATTPPTLTSQSSLAVIYGAAPMLSGTSDTGLTDPASAPATFAALTSQTSRPYVQVL